MSDIKDEVYNKIKILNPSKVRNTKQELVDKINSDTELDKNIKKLHPDAQIAKSLIIDWLIKYG